MSEIVEKTLESLQSFLGRDKDGRWSVGFRELVQAVAAGRTNPQMDAVLKKETNWLQRQLSKPQLKPAEVRECLSRALYCELLGYDVSFTYIHAIKLAQQGSILEKRAGYLAATMFLHPNHELSYLIIGTIQKDLKSSNPVEVCLGLSAIPRLIGPDTAPALTVDVLERSTHCDDFVRKKACLALQHLVTQMPDKASGALFALPVLRNYLGDPDFGVVTSALGFLWDLVQEDAFPVRDLGQLCVPLCEVLSQIIQHKVPSDLVHQGVPAPWTQILLLRILAKVGKHCKAWTGLADVLQEVMVRVGLNCGIAAAVLCECVNTSLELDIINPDTLVKVVAPLMQTVDPNIRYMGVKTLGPLLARASKDSISDELRPSVIEGLYSGDESVRSGTLNLLFQLADATNVEVICAKMLEFIHSADCESNVTRFKVGGQSLKLAHQFHPDVKWYLRTALDVVKTVPEAFCPEAFGHLLSSLRNVGKDNKDGIYAVNITLKVLQEATTENELLVKLALRTVGDFWEEGCDMKPHELWGFITNQTETHVNNRDIMSSVLLAARKILIRQGPSGDVDSAAKLVELCSVSEFPEVRQAIREIQNFTSVMETRVDLKLEDFELQRTDYDWTLTFLDSAVVEALQRGASPYDESKSLLRVGHVESYAKPTLQFGPYEGPVLKAVDEGSLSVSSNKMADESRVLLESDDVSLNLVGIKKVWKMKGSAENSAENIPEESLLEMENPDKELGNYAMKDDRLQLIDALFGSSQLDEGYKADK